MPVNRAVVTPSTHGPVNRLALPTPVQTNVPKHLGRPHPALATYAGTTVRYVRASHCG